jgi:hypothetical protein
MQAVSHANRVPAQLVAHFWCRDDAFVAQGEAQPLHLPVKAHERHPDVLRKDEIGK